MGVMTANRRLDKPYLVAAAALMPFALCLICGASLAAEQVWLARARPEVLQSGHIVRLCGSVRPTRDFRVALWWGPAFNPRTNQARKPFIQSNLACGLAPWLPLLPDTGGLESAE